MYNIISSRTLVDLVTEKGLIGYEEFITRCTGNSTGEALGLLAEVMLKHRTTSGKPAKVYATNKEAVGIAEDVVRRLGLKGFTFDHKLAVGASIQYCVFSEALG